MRECEKYEDLCSAYLDGEITDTEQAALTAHLSSCSNCAAYLEQLRRLSDAVKTQVTPPENLHAIIMEDVERLAQTTVVQDIRTHRHPPVFTMIAAAAAVVMLVVTGVVGDVINISTNTVTASVVTPAENQPVNRSMTAVAPSSAPAVQDAAIPEENDTAATPQTANEAQASPGVAGAEPAPRGAMFSAPLETAIDWSLPETPAAVANATYAFCYISAGTQALPKEFNGVLVADDGTGKVAYFTIENNMTVLQDNLAALSTSNFTTTVQEDVIGVSLESDSTIGLIIVVQQEG